MEDNEDTPRPDYAEHEYRARDERIAKCQVFGCAFAFIALALSAGQPCFLAFPFALLAFCLIRPDDRT